MDYRGKQISKWAAITQIFTAILSATANMNGNQQAAAGETYLAILNEHDQIFTSAQWKTGAQTEP